MPQGYLPPPSAYAASIPAFTLENDPLVNNSRLGVAGWLGKAGGVVRRSGGLILVIFVLTQFVPGVVLSVVALGFTLAQRVRPEAGALAAIVLVAVVALLAQMLGYAAAAYTATRQAAGLEVRIGEALRYGLRRCLGLGGWMFLTFLLAGGTVAVVMLCCVSVFSITGVIAMIPIVGYVLLAAAMVGPAYVFERRNPIVRSLHLLHGAFGRMLGRLLLVALVLLPGLAIDQVLAQGVGLALSESLLTAGLVAVSVVSALIDLPLALLVFSGILATYAERRGDEGYTTTDLVRQL